MACGNDITPPVNESDLVGGGPVASMGRSAVGPPAVMGRRVSWVLGMRGCVRRVLGVGALCGCVLGVMRVLGVWVLRVRPL